MKIIRCSCRCALAIEGTSLKIIVTVIVEQNSARIKKLDLMHPRVYKHHTDQFFSHEHYSCKLFSHVFLLMICVRAFGYQTHRLQGKLANYLYPKAYIFIKKVDENTVLVIVCIPRTRNFWNYTYYAYCKSLFWFNLRPKLKCSLFCRNFFFLFLRFSNQSLFSWLK